MLMMFGQRIPGLAGVTTVIVIGAALCVSTFAHASEDISIAENGVQVPTPDMDRLTCDEMNRTLMEISASGYRGVQAIAEDHPDYKIFAYENRLATVHYEDCQVGVVDFTTPRRVFSSGFN